MFFDKKKNKNQSYCVRYEDDYQVTESREPSMNSAVGFFTRRGPFHADHLWFRFVLSIVIQNERHCLWSRTIRKSHKFVNKCLVF